jgi:hypothetical protein
MTFPLTASDGQLVVINGIQYIYTSATRSWTRVQNTITSNAHVVSCGTILINGNVGVGTSSPLGSLDMSKRTDMIILPVGNTAQRPITATNGAIRYNTTTGSPEWYYGPYGLWQSLNSARSYTVNYLIVAGGGGGAGNFGGAGGAGGLISGTKIVVACTSYTITPGAGGAGAAGTNCNTSSGTNSTAFCQTAIGGGRGGVLSQCYGNGPGAGASGGSGGGGVSYFCGISRAGGSGTSGQGYGGGSGYGPCLSSGGGGGGGAGGPGGNGTNVRGGAGGLGAISAITGTGTYYASGGGGGTDSGTGGSVSAGGGSAGGKLNSNPSAATAYTGGGGGGGYNIGAAGGSGIVIVNYQSQTQRATGGCVSNFYCAGAKVWVHTFKSSGSFTA